jgi:hypothetical protein
MTINPKLYGGLGVAAAAAIVTSLVPGVAIAAPSLAEPPTPDTEQLIGPLEAGTHTFEFAEDVDALDPLVTVTVPNGEWSGLFGWILGTDGFIMSRHGVSIQFWSTPDMVYGDPCRWATTAIDVEPTVEFMADALANQALRSASAAREVTVGDHRGIELELTVPEDIDFTTCDRFEGVPYFQSWSYDSGGGRHHQGPGQHDLIRLVDVDGTLVIIDATFWPELPAETHAEMIDVLDSMTFQPAHTD